MIYFDNASTTFPKPDVVYEEMNDWLRQNNVNPGRGSYQAAIHATDKVLQTREKLATLFNIDNPLQIVFTANGTEALNLALKGLLNPGDHVITTSMEHNSMIRPIISLSKYNIEHTIVQGNDAGIIHVEKIKEAILPHTKMIAMVHAYNVTGTIQNITEIGQLANQHDLLFLVDAAQTAGVFPIDVKQMNIDLLAAPGHKGLMGIQGTGFLYIREGLLLTPLKEGGTGSHSENLEQPESMPQRYESGTLNTPGIVALGAAVNFILNVGVNEIFAHKEKIMNHFIDGLASLPIKVCGQPGLGVVSIAMEKFTPGDLSYLLDHAFNVATRSGLHCAPLAHQTIKTNKSGTVRFSFGYFNTIEEVDVALNALKKVCALDGD